MQVAGAELLTGVSFPFVLIKFIYTVRHTVSVGGSCLMRLWQLVHMIVCEIGVSPSVRDNIFPFGQQSIDMRIIDKEQNYFGQPDSNL